MFLDLRCDLDLGSRWPDLVQDFSPNRIQKHPGKIRKSWWSEILIL